MNLTRRDQGFLGALAVTGIAASIGGFLYSSGSSSSANCVSVTIASTMGGATIHKCGAAAATWCHEERPSNAQIAAACRRAGY